LTSLHTQLPIYNWTNNFYATVAITNIKLLFIFMLIIFSHNSQYHFFLCSRNSAKNYVTVAISSFLNVIMFAGYGKSCTKNQECSHVDGAICNDNMTCGCAAETIPNTNGTKCLAAARKIQEECTESVQCMASFEFSICVDKVCQCEQNYHYEHEMTRCFLNKGTRELPTDSSPVESPRRKILK